MKKLLVTFFLVTSTLVVFAQAPAVDCGAPYESSVKLAEHLKVLISKVASSPRPYSASSFKDIAKFDSYIECVKKTQGEGAPDIAKIAALKSEVLYYADYNNKAKISASADSLSQARDKQRFLDEANATACPVERYAGSDKETLKKNLKAAWAGDTGCMDGYQVLSIYLTGDSWTKEQGYDYSKSNDNFTKFDQSYLDVAVIFVPKANPITISGVEYPDYAYVFKYSLVKDHINGNKLDYLGFQCHHAVPASNSMLPSTGKYIQKSKIK